MHFSKTKCILKCWYEGFEILKKPVGKTVVDGKPGEIEDKTSFCEAALSPV
jgi:hypothetical protein